MPMVDVTIAIALNSQEVKNCERPISSIELVVALGDTEGSTLRACTLERRIVLKYDMAAPLTPLPVPTGNC